MKILAVDSSTDVCNLCVMVDSEVIAEYITRSGRTHTERLMPAIEMLFSHIDVPLHDIDLLAAVQGPGSFTGLRIGLSAVKGLAFALRRPVVGANALDLAARQIMSQGYICPAMDARRGEIFTALYRRDEAQLQRLTEPQSIAPALWRAQLPEDRVFFCGAGAALYSEILMNHPGSVLVFRDFHLSRTLAEYAQEQAVLGNTISGEQLRAAYLRPSDAETHGPKPNRKPERIPR